MSKRHDVFALQRWNKAQTIVWIAWRNPAILREMPVGKSGDALWLSGWLAVAEILWKRLRIARLRSKDLDLSLWLSQRLAAQDFWAEEWGALSAADRQTITNIVRHRRALAERALRWAVAHDLVVESGAEYVAEGVRTTFTQRGTRSQRPKKVAPILSTSSEFWEWYEDRRAGLEPAPTERADEEAAFARFAPRQVSRDLIRSARDRFYPNRKRGPRPGPRRTG